MKKRVKLIIYIVFSHLLLLVVISGFSAFPSCKKKENLQVIKTKLITLPTAQTVSREHVYSNNQKQQSLSNKSDHLKLSKVSPRKISYRTPQQIRESKLTKPKRKSEPQKYEPSPNNKVRDKITKVVDFSSLPDIGDLDWHSIYHNNLHKRIYETWEQPMKTEVGNPDVTVKVLLEIHRSGKILNKKIINRSGDLAMDSSVHKLLGRITNLPKFPANADVESVKKVVFLKLTY